MTVVKSGVTQLKQGEYLAVNQNLQSPNGQYIANLKSDGNFVVYHNIVSDPLWSTNTFPNSAAATKLIIQ